MKCAYITPTLYLHIYLEGNCVSVYTWTFYNGSGSVLHLKVINAQQHVYNFSSNVLYHHVLCFRSPWRTGYCFMRCGRSHTDLCDEVSVLGVDLGDGADLLALGEGRVQLLVAKHEHILVGHEHLEGVDALLRG